MVATLDLTIVALVLVASVLWLLRRALAPSRGACASGCGKCPEARGAPPTLVAIRGARRRPHPRPSGP